MTEPQETNSHRILAEVKGRLARSAESLVPWFYENMPEYYFRTHDEDEQIKHLHAILSAQVKTEKQAVTLKSPCGTRITHITPGGDMQTLIQVLEQYQDNNIHTARIYSSQDQALRLDTFILSPQPLCAVDDKRFLKAVDIIKGYELVLPEKESEFERFLSSASEDYVDKFEAGRAVRHFETCGCIGGTERVHVHIEKNVQDNLDRVSVAMTGPPAKGLLLRAFKIFARESVNIIRAYGDVFVRDGEEMSILSFYIDQDDFDIKPESEHWGRIERQLKTVKWFAFHGLEKLAEEDGWEVGRVMLMQAASEFAHQFLVSKNIHAYTSDKIVRTGLKHRDILWALFEYFDARFNPDVDESLRDTLLMDRRDAVREMLAQVNDDIARTILGYMFRFFRYTLRTNYYLPEKLGLAFRMDPGILAPMPAEQRPFGFYCFHGPYSFGFQVRYRDMSRGGVRVVRTRSQEQFELESNRLFDEVTKLASAQQFKNKDIPEGGSKAVILMGPDGEIDLAVKSMIDSLLDLIVVPRDENGVETGHCLPGIVDYLGRTEIIYLGPDENITPRHINWIVDRAVRRGYRWPSAFMSSKAEEGINHKVYGVTSEGVIVFTDEVLHALGIDPRKDPFTVKFTGGPAGDVASNAMRILMREYGKNARIVAMSDGHGAAYDPDGLDHRELVRLFDANLKASHFNKKKLKGEGAYVVSTDDPGGAHIRDEIHNKVVADVFIPSGGRPDTINIRNWTRFLKEDGKPSARAIVEGANIFISADARAKLEGKGVLAVPGPSANKTGVICSSYEILAGLILNKQEFLAIKETYVQQVLEILRKRARDEARVLLREYKLGGGERPLTPISYELSTAINSLADIIYQVLDREVQDVSQDKPLCDLILSYCPAVLAEKYADRIVRDIPRAHLFALVAAYFASKVLYLEGLGWADRLVKVRNVHDVIYTYLEQEKRVATLVRSVEKSKLAGKADIARILDQAGRKLLTMEKLGMG